MHFFIEICQGRPALRGRGDKIEKGPACVQESVDASGTPMTYDDTTASSNEVMVSVRSSISKGL